MVDIKFAKELKEEIADKEKIIYQLYKILDDIDTASDMFKDDYRGLARFVHKLQQKRHDLISKTYINELYDRYHVWEADKKDTNGIPPGSVLETSMTFTPEQLKVLWQLCYDLRRMAPTQVNLSLFDKFEDIRPAGGFMEGIDIEYAKELKIKLDELTKENESLKKQLDELSFHSIDQGFPIDGPFEPELTAEDEARYKQELAREAKVRFIVDYIMVVPEYELDKVIRDWVADKEKVKVCGPEPQRVETEKLIVVGMTKQEIEDAYCIIDIIAEWLPQQHRNHRIGHLISDRLERSKNIIKRLEGYIDPCQR